MRVYCDCFSKIAGHVLNNACQFAESRIDVTLDAPGGELSDDVFRVRIRDDGAGISREEQSRIFDLFYTSDADSVGGRGLGLGLAVAKHLAARMGARLGVESVVGEWTEFSLTVPLNSVAESDTADGEVSAAPRPDAVVPSGMQKRLPNILLVEDNADFADFFVRHLAECYTIHCVADGQQALDMLRRRNMSAVVSDVALKGMDGIALCTAVRNDRMLDHLPVILVSVDASSATKVRALPGRCRRLPRKTVLGRLPRLADMYACGDAPPTAAEIFENALFPLRRGGTDVWRRPFYGAGQPVCHG